MDYAFYKKLDTGRTHLLLVRHAERHEITDMRTASQVLLTEKGKKDAFRLGRRLAGRFSKKTFFHSPVERCAQSAREISRGMAAQGDVFAWGGPLAWLGGDFISAEIDFLNKQIQALGADGFLRSWFDDEYPEGAITPLARAAGIELGLIRRQLDEHEGLVIDLTHDWNLMLLLERYLSLRHEEFGIPGFLDCLVATAEGDGVRLSCRGRSAVAHTGR